MSARLKDKTVLITGGAGGIGAASATLFAAEGAQLLLVDMDSTSLERIAASIREATPGARVETLSANVADPAAATAAAQRCEQAFGRLDVLINNASMRNFSSFAEATPEEWNAIVGVNMIGTANFTRATLPMLRQAGGASVVNVSSCYAVKGRKGMALYDATKAALISMTRSLAFEEAAAKIRVNVVCPGSTFTDFHVKRTQAAGKSLDELKTQRQDTSLMGRWAEPMEIAYPILWMASDEASFITGTTLVVDGGLHIK
jgi:2-hydroxycyclohexanecarboxyl-CoA dehydrogenase